MKEHLLKNRLFYEDAIKKFLEERMDSNSFMKTFLEERRKDITLDLGKKIDTSMYTDSDKSFINSFEGIFSIINDYIPDENQLEIIKKNDKEMSSYYFTTEQEFRKRIKQAISISP